MATDDLVWQLEDEDTNSTEPALLVGASTSTVIGALYFIVKYLVPNVPDELIQAVMSVLAIVIPLVVAWITRGKVWSPGSVQRVVDQSVTNAMRDTNSKLPRRNPNPEIDPEKFPPTFGTNKDF